MISIKLVLPTGETVSYGTYIHIHIYNYVHAYLHYVVNLIVYILAVVF